MAFIDELFIKGGLTKAQIIDKTFDAYGECKEAARKVIATRVHERPYWIRKAGHTPKWEEVS